MLLPLHLSDSPKTAQPFGSPKMKAFRIAEPSVVFFQPLLGSVVIIDGTILFLRLCLFDFPKTAQPFGSPRMKAFQIAESYGIRIEALVLVRCFYLWYCLAAATSSKNATNSVSISPVPTSNPS